MGVGYGRFEEVIPPDVAVKADSVTADYKHGVLHITAAKEESAQSRKITVKAG